METEEMTRLLNHLPPDTDAGDLPLLYNSYQALVKNPRAYIAELDPDFLDTKRMIDIQEFVQTLGDEIMDEEWETLTTFQTYLEPNPILQRAILLRETPGLHTFAELWFNKLMEKIRRTYTRNKDIITHEDTQQRLLQDYPYLVTNLRGLISFFIEIQAILVIQDENKLFRELLQLHQMIVLSYFYDQLQSIKSKLQLQKYMVRYVQSKLPQNFTSLEVAAVLHYFSHQTEKLETDVTLQLITKIEHFKRPLKKKKPALENLIFLLGRQNTEELKKQAWEYPRLRIRKLFLPMYIKIASQDEIRQYWKKHSSDSSRKSLLKDLIGHTSDPYFLNIMLERFPEERRAVLTGLLHADIVDQETVGDFLLELPDKYTREELELTLSGYFYRRQPFAILRDIIEKIEKKRLQRKILAKFRIAGIRL